MTSKEEFAQKMARISQRIGAIGKDQKSDGISYKFRSIDAIINKLNPIMAEEGITVSQRVKDFNVERFSFEKWDNFQKKNVIKSAYRAHVLLEVVFSDGENSESTEECAMSEDYSDKAPTQAMSMAFKYAITRKFLVMTEEMKDPDSSTGVSTDGETVVPAPAAKLALVKDDGNWSKVVNAITELAYTVDSIASKYEITDDVRAELEKIKGEYQAKQIKGK